MNLISSPSLKYCFKFLFITFCCCISASLYLKSGFISTCAIGLAISGIGYFIFQKKINHVPVLYLFMIFYSMILLSALLHSSFSDSFNIIERRIPFLLIPMGFLLVDIRLTKKHIQIILGIFVLACMICSLICYTMATINVIRSGTFSLVTERQYYYFSFYYLTEPVNIDPIYLGLYSNFAFAIVLETDLINKKYLRYFLALYLSIFTLLISSKIGVITLFILVLIHIIYTIKRKLTASVLILGILFIFAGSVAGLPFLKTRFINSLRYDITEDRGNIWNSSTLRLAIWSCALEAIKEKPILGYGTSKGQQALFEIYKKRNFVWGLRDAYNPHSEFIYTLLDWGIIGFLLLVFVIAYQLMLAIKIMNPLIIGFITIIILSFLVECVLLRQKGIILYVFFSSLLFSHYNVAKTVKSDNSQ